jgi:hypothetical protein
LKGLIAKPSVSGGSLTESTYRKDSIMAQSSSSTQTLHKDDLLKFTGDLERFRHPINPKVIYTPGVQYLAEEAQAYWLLDAIASYFGTQAMQYFIKQDSRLADLQFWKLTVKEACGQLTARADSDAEPFVVQDIPFTDFPLDEIDIWAGFDGKFWTLYLPSEH